MIKKNKNKDNVNDNIITFETFRKIGDYEISNMKRDEPSCFNSMVSFRKYRIVIELIDEPHDVLCERLQKLWDTTKNHHDWRPIEYAAKEIGYTLQGRPGNK